MIKKIYLGSLLVSMSAFVYAQQEQPNPYKHDIGFSTSVILQGILNTNGTPFSLMYKKYTADRKAWRFGLNAGFYFPGNSNLYPGSSSYINSNANVQGFVGKEFQRNITMKWTWYYGGDVGAYYTKNRSEYYSNGTLSFHSFNWDYGLKGRPFLGIRFNINPRLYVSAEASIAVNVGRTHAYFLNDQDSSLPGQDTFSNNISLSMLPASGVFLFYRF